MPNRERWRLIPGYGDCYFVSDRGRVLSMKMTEPNVMHQGTDDVGYPVVQFCQNNRISNVRVHRLVCEAFHGPAPEGHECRHLNGDKQDCRASNLKWGTQSENTLDRVRHGVHHHAAKTHCPQGHPYDVNNTYRRPSKPNSRDCRACHRARYQKQTTASARTEVAA